MKTPIRISCSQVNIMTYFAYIYRRHISKKHYKTNYCLVTNKFNFSKKNSKKKISEKKISKKKISKKKVVSDAKYGFIRHTRSLKFLVYTSSAFSAILYFDILTTIEIMTCSGFQISEEVYAYFYLYFCAKNVVKTICAYLMS